MIWKRVWPLLLCLILPLFIFWKLPVKGLIPFPGDLLAGRFFPWNTIEWSGYELGVPYKEFIAADTVRQTYPWRQLAIEQLRQGNVPYWNPYTFAGTPLLANMQSAPFYPLNLIYLVLSFNLAWVFQVMLQPVLAMVFMYLFLRDEKLSKLASILASLGFAFSGYMIVWLELNTVGHAALWLPLILLGIKRAVKQPKYYWLVAFSLIASFFANHIQTTLYIGILSLIWFVFQWKQQKNTSQFLGKHLVYLIAMLTGVVSIISIQLLPAIRLLEVSARSGVDSKIFSQFLLPWSHLITFIVPNYFGNPATNNYFGQDYGEFMAYFGVVAVSFALVVIYAKKKSDKERFFLVAFFISLLFALNSPVAHLPRILRIPILESSAPARILFMTQFFGSVLAAYGFDRYKKNSKVITKSLIFLGTCFTLLILFALSKIFISADETIKAQAKVSLRNTVIPLASYMSLVGLYFLDNFVLKNKKQRSWLITTFVLIIPTIGYSFFANKYLPFSEPGFMFAEAPPFEFIASQENQARFFGDYTASVTSNIWMPSKVYGVEGYDSLYIKRYGELLAAAQLEGQKPEKISRSDANLEPNNDDFYRRRLQNVLGIRYLLHKIDFPESNWMPDVDRFPTNRYELIWQEGKFQVYENKNFLPRVMLVPTYQLLSSDEALLERFYDQEWDPTKIVLVEEKPYSTVHQRTPFQHDSVNFEDFVFVGEAEIVSYEPNRVEIEYTSELESLLVLSDSYYPGWEARLDGNEVPILRANYAFRAILAPPGEHTLIFSYE